MLKKPKKNKISPLYIIGYIFCTLFKYLIKEVVVTLWTDISCFHIPRVGLKNIDTQIRGVKRNKIFLYEIYIYTLMFCWDKNTVHIYIHYTNEHQIFNTLQSNNCKKTRYHKVKQKQHVYSDVIWGKKPALTCMTHGSHAFIHKLIYTETMITL